MILHSNPKAGLSIRDDRRSRLGFWSAMLGGMLWVAGLSLAHGQAMSEKVRWDALNMEAGSAMGEGRYDDALRLAREAVDLAEATFGKDRPQGSTSLNTLALIQQKRGELAEAEVALRRALAIDERTLPPNHVDYASTANNLGNLLAARGDYAQAVTHLQRAIEIRETALGPDHADLSYPLANIASELIHQGKPELAIEAGPDEGAEPAAADAADAAATPAPQGVAEPAPATSNGAGDHDPAQAIET